MYPALLAQAGNTAVWLAFAFIVLFALIFLAVFARYFGLWIQAKTTRAGISLPNLVMMSIRKVNPTVIVRGKIMAVQGGLTDSYPISTRALEAHYLAGGDVLKVIRALVAAHKAKLGMDWQVAQAIDLAGRDVLDAVRTSVYPKVIDCPDPK
ncbi:MAG: flotillin-like FloA family protein, partial [Maioricimonas sp. JB049]